MFEVGSKMSHMPVSGGSPHHRAAGHVDISHGNIMWPNWQHFFDNKFEQPHFGTLDGRFLNNGD